MNASTYFVVSGSIFGIVGILHLVRVIGGWELVLGTWPAPMWVSWFGAIIPLVLCITAFRLLSRLSK